MSRVLDSTFVVNIHSGSSSSLLHKDIRIRIPDTDLWFSFSTKKELPLKRNQKVVVYRSDNHNTKAALKTGPVLTGKYRGGNIERWDEGRCEMFKFGKTENDKYTVVKFYGDKLKGVFHFIKMAKTPVNDQDSYLMICTQD